MNPAAILYYIPANSARFGLFGSRLSGIPERIRHRFQDGCTKRQSTGPDGSQGLLITWQRDVLLEYAPDRQTWKRTGDVWRGVRRDATSAEFAKPDAPARGYTVPLGDGRRYVIPVALATAPNCEIPWRETLNEAGHITREIDPLYDAVCRAADMLWEHIEDNGTFSMEDDTLRVACANAIAVNYRLDLEDCLFLGLFTTESYREIIRAILDLPELEQMAQKKTSGTSGTGSGVTESSPTTSLPTQT